MSFAEPVIPRYQLLAGKSEDFCDVLYSQELQTTWLCPNLLLPPSPTGPSYGPPPGSFISRLDRLLLYVLSHQQHNIYLLNPIFPLNSDV